MTSRLLYIICEGASELALVKAVLQPFLYAHSGLLVHPINMRGNVSFARLKKEFIMPFLARGSFVTTFIDYYKLSTDFPKYEVISKFVCYDSDLIYANLDRFESCLASDINSSRFIPYIQLHEYEMIYFADHDSFCGVLPETSSLIHQYFVDTNSEINNPELINNGILTAPSARIRQCLKQNLNIDYSRLKHHYARLYGNKCVLDAITNRCPHFKQWLDKLCVL